ncbi:MAG: rhodanese-like domain-containing protein [Chloroflexota bacterium]|nr:rhodanese-like domain-containing protein [Chloroflexota bacterium]
MGIFDKLKKIVAKREERKIAPPSRYEPTPNREPEVEPVSIPETTCQELYAAMRAGEDVTLLDVRRAWDHEAQHPIGSVSLPLDELPHRLDELDPSKRYVLSCYHGYTSLDGAAFLMDKGFTDVQSLKGGFSHWASAGLPIEGKYADQQDD